ncbi:MAG TPA: hypothetical protein DCS67_00430 [Clostridiales bacterium UBA8960]|jgi:hypothetical protein|nr:hypothetical protein [Clostridiales bacterium UBA8960]
MNEDELRVLKMIEAGTITAEEGMRLIQALGQTDKLKQSKSRKNVKSIRLHIQDELKTSPVDIKLPIGLFKAGIKIGEKFSPELQQAMSEINYEDIMQSVDEGVLGEIMTVTTNDGHLVIIYLE